MNLDKTRKSVGLNLLTLFKLEYSKEVGKFDIERYSQALKNYRDTINEIGISPPKAFLMMGIEYLHLLPPESKKMLKYIVKRGREIEAEALPEMFRQLIYSFANLQNDPEIKKFLEQNQPKQLPKGSS